MSKTAVSELNARMSIDISQMEQAVPRATALLKRLSVTQAEAFAAQSGGPDLARLEDLRSQFKQPGVLGLPGGKGYSLFQDPKAELAFVDDISAANDESLRRRAAREAAIRAQQKNAVDANLAEIKLVDDAMAATAERQAARDRERMEYEQMLADRRAASARAQIEFADAQRDIIQNNARDSAGAFIAEQRNADERLATEQRIADIRRRQAQVRASGEYERANPFERQVLAVQELNRLIGVQRNLRRAGITTDEQRLALAEAELAVTRQIQTVRGLRESLTAGTNLSRLGNTAEDSQARFARFGLAMQQTGYQVQDFSVQVASGTNMLVAFSQQSSQLLGFFGGWQGAVAGAVISTGILAYRLLDTASATNESTRAYKTNKEALDALIESRRKLDLLRDPSKERAYLESDRRSALQRVQLAKLELEAAKAAATAGMSESRKRELALAKIVTQLAFGSAAAEAFGFAVTKGVKNNLEGAVTDAGLSLDELEVKLNGILSDIQNLDNTKLSDATSRGNSLIDTRNSLLERRDEINSRGLTIFEKLRKAQQEAEGWVPLDEEGRQFVEGLNLEIDDLFQQAGEVAKKYKEQLNPLLEQKRVFEEINELQNLNMLTAEEAELLQLRMADERARQLKLPEMFKAETGASFAGLRNTDGTASQIVATQQQMLAELRKLVWQGSN